MTTDGIQDKLATQITVGKQVIEWNPYACSYLDKNRSRVLDTFEIAARLFAEFKAIQKGNRRPEMDYLECLAVLKEAGETQSEDLQPWFDLAHTVGFKILKPLLDSAFPSDSDK